MADLAQIEELIRGFEERQRDELTALLDKLRAATRALPSTNAPDPSTLTKISIGEAAYLSELSESQVRKLCEANPSGEPGGFGYKKGGRWEVIKDPFLTSRGMRVSRD